MSLVSFSVGDSQSLASAAQKEGRFTFVPQSDSDGWLYLDLNDTRRLISTNTSEITNRLTIVENILNDATDGASISDVATINRRLNKLESLILVHATSVSLPTTSFEFEAGEYYTVYASISPTDCNDDITWEVLDPSIVRIENWINNTTAGTHGVILYALDSGSTTLTLTIGNFTVTANITVDSVSYTKTTLAEDYTPDGTSFMFTAPVSLQDGDYIEIKGRLQDDSVVKENIITIGHNIDKGSGANTGARVGLYASQTASHLQDYVRFYCNHNTRGISNIELSLMTNGEFVYKLDKHGLWVNGILVTLDNQYWSQLIEELVTYTSFDIGSVEGTNRSHCYYDYIAYYTRD